MSLYKNYKQIGFVLAIFSLLFMQIAPIQAAMLENGDLLNQESPQLDRQQLKALLDRGEVQQQLIAFGVDAEAAADRIERMTDSEVLQLNQQISEMPAGSGVVEIILIVFIVFVVTDVLGATDIFPFIKPIR